MNKKISTVLLIFYTFIEILSFFNFNIFSFLNKFNVFFSLIIFMLVSICNFNILSKKNILFLIFLTVLLVFSIFLNNGSIGSVLNIICLIIGFIVFSKINIPKMYYKCFLFMLIILLLFYVYKSRNILYTTLYFKNTDFNSNTIAQVILYINIFIFLLFSKYKWNANILYILIVPISFLGIINTQSRGAALGYVTFLILFLFRNFVFFKKKSGLIITLLSIVGTFFPIFYLNLYKNNVNFIIPYMNKSLYTGREVLWLYAYENMILSPLNIFIGLGANFSIVGQEVLNLHNMFFALIVNFGIIVFAIIMIWLYIFIKNNINEKYKYCIIPIVLLSFFETTILWNAILIFILLTESLIVKKNDISNEMRDKI